MKILIAFSLFKLDRESYCSKKTLVYYDENVPKFFKFVADALSCSCEDVFCEDVTRQHVLDYISHLRSSGVKNTTVNTYFRAVKVFLNYCIEEGYCAPDVLRKIKFLKSDQESILPLSSWEVDEIEGLYSDKTETGLRNLCIIHLMLDAGFRVSDCVNLKVSNVSFTGNYITVKGKGGKVRTVPLVPKLKKMLYRYQVFHRSYSSGADDSFFLKLGSAEPLTSDAIKMLFARMKSNSEVERVHPHLLRHTFATSYILGGGNLEFLRIMMGHSDYGTTKLYLHLAQQAKMLHSDIYKLDPFMFRSMY